MVSAICIVLELGLRLFGYGSFTIYRPDNRLLWVPVPGRALTVVNHLPITVNDQGFRYAVDLQPKQSGEFRVMASATPPPRAGEWTTTPTTAPCWRKC